MTTPCCDDQLNIGSDPINIKWNVVRGDTATITVQFFNKDEVTLIDTSTWLYAATAYDAKTNTSYSLLVDAQDGYVTISALPLMTEQWGTGYSTKVAELSFDLEVTITPENVWTPIIGTISVLGDVTGVLL